MLSVCIKKNRDKFCLCLIFLLLNFKKITTFLVRSTNRMDARLLMSTLPALLQLTPLHQLSSLETRTQITKYCVSGCQGTREAFRSCCICTVDTTLVVYTRDVPQNLKNNGRAKSVQLPKHMIIQEIKSHVNRADIFGGKRRAASDRYILTCRFKKKLLLLLVVRQSVQFECPDILRVKLQYVQIEMIMVGSFYTPRQRCRRIFQSVCRICDQDVSYHLEIIVTYSTICILFRRLINLFLQSLI